VLRGCLSERWPEPRLGPESESESKAHSLLRRSDARWRFAADVAVKWTYVDVAAVGMSRMIMGGSMATMVTIDVGPFPGQNSNPVSPTSKSSAGSAAVVEARASPTGLVCEYLRK